MRVKLIKKLKRKIYLNVNEESILKNKYGFCVFLDKFGEIDTEKTFTHHSEEAKLNSFLWQYGANKIILKNGLDEFWDYSGLDLKLNKVYEY